MKIVWILQIILEEVMKLIGRKTILKDVVFSTLLSYHVIENDAKKESYAVMSILDANLSRIKVEFP